SNVGDWRISGPVMLSLSSSHVDPFRKSGTRICCNAQRKSYAVFYRNIRERIAIERVPAAWKSSLENRPYGGEAQVVSSVGRPLFKVHAPSSKRNLKDYVGLWKLGRTRADHDQTIRRGSQGSEQSDECGKSFGRPQCLSSNPRCIMSPSRRLAWMK